MWLLIGLLTLAPLVMGQSPIAGPADSPKSASVSGIVIDQQENRPLSHVTVCIIPDRNGFDDGTSYHCDETDTRGQFNVADLPPGRFTYRADRAGFFMSAPLADGLSGMLGLAAGDEIHDVKLRMQPAGVIAGRVLYQDGEPYVGATLSLSGRHASGLTTATNDLGEYRFANLFPDDYSVQVVSTNPFSNCEAFAARNPRIYVEQSADQPASPLHVNAAQTVTRPDLVMVPVTPRRVSGRIIWDKYPLPGAWQVFSGNRTVASRPSDGTFSLCGLPPGRHTLRVAALSEGRTIQGDVTIRVAGEDLKNVEIVPEASALIHAWIEVEGDLPLDLSHAAITSLSNTPYPHDSVPQVRGLSDETYVIRDLYTAEYRFSLYPLPPGSYLKSVRAGGREFIDAPLMVESGDTIDGLVFTVSTNAGALNGMVQDETGSPAPGAFVVVQPDPPHIDPDIHTCERTADQNGAFTCPNLAPGKYRVAAWAKVPGPQGGQDAVHVSGTPVEIPESGQVAIPVPLIK
jgi:hypothetical protein